MNSGNLTFVDASFDGCKDFDFGCVTKKNQVLISDTKMVFATIEEFINFYQNNRLGFEQGIKIIYKTLRNPKLN